MKLNKWKINNKVKYNTNKENKLYIKKKSFDNYLKKEVRNLDQFHTLNYHTKSDNKYYNLSFENHKEIDEVLNLKIKNILSSIYELRMKKLKIVKVKNFLEIIKYFNVNNKNLINIFIEIFDCIKKVKSKYYLEINKNVSKTNDLNYKLGNLINTKKYLKNKLKINNDTLNEKVKIKYFLLKKAKKELRNSKKSILLKRNSSYKRPSVFDLNKNNSILLDEENNAKKRGSVFSKLSNNNVLKKSIDKFKNLKKNSRFLNKNSDEDNNNLKNCLFKDYFFKRNSIKYNENYLSTKDKKIDNTSKSSMSSKSSKSSKTNKSSKSSNSVNSVINISNDSFDRNKISRIDSEINKITNENLQLNKEFENNKKNNIFIINSMTVLEKDLKYKNNIMDLIIKKEKKIKKIYINFLKDEIEFGYDIKNNGILWLYFELIKLNYSNLQIYPIIFNNNFKSYLNDLINDYSILYKYNKKLRNLKFFNKFLYDDKNDLDNNLGNNIIQEKSVIKLPNIKNTIRSRNNNYQSYDLKSIKEINFNINFIDEDNTIQYKNIKSINLEKKKIFEYCNSLFSNIKDKIKTNKKFLIKESVVLPKKIGLDRFIHIISCLHGYKFVLLLFKKQ